MDNSTVPAWFAVATLAVGAAGPIISQWVQVASVRRARREDSEAARDAERRGDVRSLQDAIAELIAVTTTKVSDAAFVPAVTNAWKWTARVGNDELRELATDIVSKAVEKRGQQDADWSEVGEVVRRFSERVAAALRATQNG